MKKVTLVLVIFFTAFLFTGCTDNAQEFQDRIKAENELKAKKLSDKDEEPERD